MKNKNILLVGANSFVGKRIAEQLSAKYNIIGTYHSKKNLAVSRQEKLDVADKNEVCTVLEKTKPELIILAAAISSTSESEGKLADVNVKGVSNFVECLKDSSAPRPKLIFFSTEQIFDGKQGLYSESDRPNPLNAYGKSKLEAEKIVQSYADHIILRCAVIMGAKKEGDHDNFISNFISSDKKMKIFRDAYRTSLYVNDIPLIIHKLIENNFNGIINLSNNDLLSYKEMARKIEAAFKIKKQYFVVKCEQPSMPKKLGLRNALLKKAIGYEPTGFDDMLIKIKKEMNFK